MINAGYSITELTKAAGISRQAYYKWCHRRPTIHEVQDQEILKLIKQLEEEHKFSVGYDKMTRLINLSQELEYRVNKKRIKRIMNQYGIRADYRQPNVKGGLKMYDLGGLRIERCQTV